MACSNRSYREARGKESFVLHRGLLEVPQPVHVRRYRNAATALP
jgi:hypothetical protein